MPPTVPVCGSYALTVSPEQAFYSPPGSAEDLSDFLLRVAVECERENGSRPGVFDAKECLKYLTGLVAFQVDNSRPRIA